MEGEFCRAPEAICSFALSSRASLESLQLKMSLYYGDQNEEDGRGIL